MIENREIKIKPCIDLINKKGYHILSYDVHVGGIVIVFNECVRLPNIPEEYHFSDDGQNQVITKCYMGIDKDILDTKIEQYDLQLLNWTLRLPWINNKKRGYGLWEKIRKTLKMTH